MAGSILKARNCPGSGAGKGDWSEQSSWISQEIFRKTRQGGESRGGQRNDQRHERFAVAAEDIESNDAEGIRER